MSVTERDRKILMHCHAGCTVDDICAALGIEKKDLFEDDLARGGGRVRGSKGSASEKPCISVSSPAAAAARPKKSGGHGKLVCTYIYRDADGAPLFKVERRVMANGKKTFLAFHVDPEAKGGWTWGIHDRSGGGNRLLVPYVAPYHLPQLVQAAQAGRALVIVEGEKDVETVERVLGVPATCNPFGSGKWGIDWPADWGKWFQGLKSIVIVADKDPETITRTLRGKKVEKPFLVGQKHAWDVRKKLEAQGVKAIFRMMCMPDVGDRHVKDFTDWVEARQAAGLACDKTAFLGALAEFGEWPESWQFTDEALAGMFASARAEKNGARAAASSVGSPVAPGDTNAGRDAASDDDEEIGDRFGRLRPRAPDEDVEIYEVDFRLGQNRVVRLEAMSSQPLVDNIMIMCGRVRKKLVEGESLSASLVRQIEVIVCVMWLRSRGRFFWNADIKGYETSIFLDRKTGLPSLIRSGEFMSWLASEAGINRKERAFEFIMAMIDDAALSEDVSRGVVPSCGWERRGDVIYISCGDSEMWRVRGSGCDKVQNGTDGVLFVQRQTLAPWKLLDGNGVDPFSTARVFTGAGWDDAVRGPMNVRLWVLNLFACHRTKPALLLTGLFQSGKTRMAYAIKQVLGMRWNGMEDSRIHRMADGENGEDAFWVAVDTGKVEIFDNVDTKIKWLGDALQTALTGGSSPRRKKYSDKEMVTLRANSSIILTSNNPMFATEGGGGLADRLVAIHLSAPSGRENLDDELTAEIERNRDEYMTWIMRTLVKALADSVPVDKSINKRHPEYGKFSVRCGRAFGNEAGAIDALCAAECDKAILPLMNHAVCRHILRVLAQTGYQLKFTSGDMSAKIIGLYGEDVDEATKKKYSAQRVGNAMTTYKQQFYSLLVMDPPRMLQGRTLYEVKGLRNPSAFNVLTGGQVDLKQENGETPTRAEAREVIPNSRVVSTCPPPYTRAPDDFLPSREEEEDIETMAELEGFE